MQAGRRGTNQAPVASGNGGDASAKPRWQGDNQGTQAGRQASRKAHVQKHTANPNFPLAS